MNIINKYWNSVYLYILILIPGACMCAGLFYTTEKLAGWYPDAPWIGVFLFDLSQVIYLLIALRFIQHKRKVTNFSELDIKKIKRFITVSLFIQYNFIIHLFPTYNTWSCTAIFMGFVAFLFDTKLMIVHIVGYMISLVFGHILYWDQMVPVVLEEFQDAIYYRLVVLSFTSTSIIIITHLAEKFLMQAREQELENVHLMEKQLDYYHNCDLMDTELRKFRHDIKGHFLCMDYLLESEDYEELAQYFSDLKESFEIQKKIYFTGNLILDSVINYDIPNRCNSYVKKTITGRLPEIATISSIDLCTLFSNMLSNAIQAVNKCLPEEKTQLSIHFDCGSSYFSIVIINSSSTETLGSSAKSEDRNHGYGIKKIKDICEKYNGSFQQEQVEDLVHTTVYLPL